MVSFFLCCQCVSSISLISVRDSTFESSLIPKLASLKFSLICVLRFSAISYYSDRIVDREFKIRRIFMKFGGQSHSPPLPSASIDFSAGLNSLRREYRTETLGRQFFRFFLAPQSGKIKICSPLCLYESFTLQGVWSPLHFIEIWSAKWRSLFNRPSPWIFTFTFPRIGKLPVGNKFVHSLLFIPVVLHKYPKGVWNPYKFD